MTEDSENHSRKIGYARVSTIEQNLDMQIAALEKYGIPRNLIFTDRMSGASSKRPGFAKALKMARHEGTEFVVWKLDRLGRTVMGIIETMQRFEEDGVRLVSITDKFDLGTPMGRAMLQLLAVFAELERDLIRERTIAGIERARERGENPGRPNAMTEERVALARQMLIEGKHIVKEILPAVKKLPGPPIAKATLYAWTKDNKRLIEPEDDTDDF